MSAWFLLIVSVLTGTAGDLLNAKSMRDHGEIHDFRPGAVAGVIAWLARDFSMLTGIVAQAVSFFSFAALLGVADLSFAVPATALGNVAKIFLRKHSSESTSAGGAGRACCWFPSACFWFLYDIPLGVWRLAFAMALTLLRRQPFPFSKGYK